ncbi:unnamed protein product, partial [Nesidiocoris tenuis]
MRATGKWEEIHHAYNRILEESNPSLVLSRISILLHRARDDHKTEIVAIGRRLSSPQAVRCVIRIFCAHGISATAIGLMTTQFQNSYLHILIATKRDKLEVVTLVRQCVVKSVDWKIWMLPFGFDVDHSKRPFQHVHSTGHHLDEPRDVA